MTSATSFCRSPAVVVHSQWRSTMASDWTDAVVVSNSQRHGFSVFARKHGDTSEALNANRWQTVRVVNNIRTPWALLASLESARATLDISLDWECVLAEVNRLNPKMAAALEPQRQRGHQIVSAIDVERSLAGEPLWDEQQRSLLNTLHENCRIEEIWRSNRARRASDQVDYPWLAVEERLFENPVERLRNSRAYGLGCSASYLDGIDLDILAYAGFRYSDELHDALWSEWNWMSVINQCPSSECVEVGEQDDAPGMSDVFFWVSVGHPLEFARELRSVIVESLIQYRASRVST